MDIAVEDIEGEGVAIGRHLTEGDIAPGPSGWSRHRLSVLPSVNGIGEWTLMPPTRGR